MFDELVETSISGDGKITVKRYIADEQTAAEIDVLEASEALKVAEERWARLDSKAEKRDIAKVMNGLRWATISGERVRGVR
jgi:hypothetical protein